MPLRIGAGILRVQDLDRMVAVRSTALDPEGNRFDLADRLRGQ